MSTAMTETTAVLTPRFMGCYNGTSTTVPRVRCGTVRSCPSSSTLVCRKTETVPQSEETSSAEDFNEDEVLNRFKVIRHDIGDKVISLSEDVLVTCDNWRDPKSSVLKLEASISDPKKKHLVFYDMCHDEIVLEIMSLLRRKCQNRCWKLVEFRGCQERHINAILRTVLEMDIVQTIAFSLTNEKYDPMRRGTNSTFEVIGRSMENNIRFECLIFHSRPIHFIQHDALKSLRVKRLHFLENVNLHSNEVTELAVGLKFNTSLKSFSFLGNVTQISDGRDVSKIVSALKGHPTLERLSLCLTGSGEEGVSGLDDLISCPNSALTSVTFSGGFTTNSLFAKESLSRGLENSTVKHLHLRDIFLFPEDVIDLALGIKLNCSLESFSIKLDATDRSVNVAPIAFALEHNHSIRRLALTGRCSLGEGVHGIKNLLTSKKSALKDLLLSGAFLDKSLRARDYLEIFNEGLRGNTKLENLDLSVNDLTDEEAVMVYEQVCTCPNLTSLDLGMNDISQCALESFSEHPNPTQLSVLRVSSPKFSFFQINDSLCSTIKKLLSKNPRLNDVNFNMGIVEWHQTYLKGKMQWHHFFPAYRVYALHSNNKRVQYLKNKELNEEGKRDLDRIQYLLDYNWAGRTLANSNDKTPLALWPRVLERIGKGRTCFWTGRKEKDASLTSSHDVTYSLLRNHVAQFLKADKPMRVSKRRQRDMGQSARNKMAKLSTNEN
ncbi:MAG: hypothetical protein SGILL_002015 [Bacillariaceae sp.]